MDAVYVHGAAHVTCWMWDRNGIQPYLMPIPEGRTHIWDVLRDLGYRSIARYGKKKGLRTDVYCRHLQHEPDSLGQYVVLTVVGNPTDAPEQRQIELVHFPHWLATIGYLKSLLPVIEPAQLPEKEES